MRSCFGNKINMLPSSKPVMFEFQQCRRSDLVIVQKRANEAFMAFIKKFVQLVRLTRAAVSNYYEKSLTYQIEDAKSIMYCMPL